MKLSLVGLAGFEQRMPAELSGACRSAPPLPAPWPSTRPSLFLDEPSAGLDPITSAGLDELILRLARNLGITFVVVSHELQSIFTHRRPGHHARQASTGHRRGRDAGGFAG